MYFGVSALHDSCKQSELQFIFQIFDAVCHTAPGKTVAHTRLPSMGVVPELTPVLGSHPVADVSHKPGGRLPLLSARPAVTPATLKRAATSVAAW